MKRLRRGLGRFREVGERMTAVGAALRVRVVKAKPLLPGFRDINIYGGLLVLGAGLWLSPWPWAGLAVPGVIAVYLGVWRLE